MIDIEGHADRSRNICEAARYCRSLADLLDKTNAGELMSGELKDAEDKINSWFAHIGKKLGAPS